MTAPGTKIYRFQYRGQGQVIGLIDPSTQKMVMLHADSGKFWSGWKLYDNHAWARPADVSPDTGTAEQLNLSRLLVSGGSVQRTVCLLIKEYDTDD
jgi:hypothetical protein